MVFEDYKEKDSVIVVYTGENKGKTSASLGLMVRALGTGWRVAYVQFIKHWEVGEHKFIHSIMPLYKDKLDFYKGGLGFFNAGELSAKATKQEHIDHARKTYEFAFKAATSGDYQLVICDEINNAVHDGLLTVKDMEKLIDKKHSKTSLCFTGRNFPMELIDRVDIATEMKKLKHHFDNKNLANKGIDF
ncbi:MAG: cob(I)yrinic acid a,c-diamide adenosyltransferase [Candidatus Saccharibacteria bacterium]|nr:cob(I)yrinic acid a,c-diamide adenosyltransferase [Candidatus Saccharibacteria bacterium]